MNKYTDNREEYFDLCYSIVIPLVREYTQYLYNQMSDLNPVYHNTVRAFDYDFNAYASLFDVVIKKSLGFGVDVDASVWENAMVNDLVSKCTEVLHGLDYSNLSSMVPPQLVYDVCTQTLTETLSDLAKATREGGQVQ